jgi:hypothetical protein
MIGVVCRFIRIQAFRCLPSQMPEFAKALITSKLARADLALMLRFSGRFDSENHSTAAVFPGSSLRNAGDQAHSIGGRYPVCILIRDDVIGHANERFDFHRDSQLFAEFANDSIFQPLHKLHAAAREAPRASFGLLLPQQQENLSILQNHTADAWDNCLAP